MELELLNLRYLEEKGFYATTSGDHPDDIIGLWQDKPEPFNLERALNGEFILLRNGLKAEMFKALDKPDACGFQYFGLSHQSNNNGIWYHDRKWNRKLQASRIVDDTEGNYDIVGMWKDPEPEPVLTNTNSLSLPKPCTEPLNDGETYYVLDIVEGKFTVTISEWNDDTLDIRRLNGRRIYKVEEEVEQVIKIITGA